MKQFLEEYGPLIIAAVAIIIIVAIVKSDVVRDTVQNGLTTILKNFTNSAVSSTPTVPNP